MKKLQLVGTSPDDQVVWSYGPNLVTYVNIGAAHGGKKQQSLSRCYWRMSDPGDKDLFSVELEEYSGGVLMMELTAYSGTLCAIPNNWSEQLKVTHGVPKFNTSSLQSGNLSKVWPLVYDVPNKFILQVSQECLRIEMFSDVISHFVVVDNKLIFELNNNDELCAITLKGFDTQCQNNIIKEFERRREEKRGIKGTVG